MKTGPVNKKEMPGDRHTAAVHMVSFNEMRTAVCSNSGNAELIIEVLGEFEKEYVQKVKVVETTSGRTAFGFFPWSLANRPWQTPVLDHILALIVNYGLALTPTAYSLLVEPFSSYPENGMVNDHVFAGFSLFGFYRYTDLPEEMRLYNINKYTNRKINIYRVSDFSVEFEGKIYSTENGHVRLPVSYESGMEIRCKLLTVKIPRGNLDMHIKQYIGKELCWQAIGVKPHGSNKDKIEHRSENVRNEAMELSWLVGKWESYQSCSIIFDGLSIKGNVEQNQIIHCTYSFLDNGEYRQVMDVSGNVTTWVGKWSLQDGEILLKITDKSGSEVQQVMNILKSKKGRFEVQYKKPELFARMIIDGVKSVKTEYVKDSYLKMEMTVVNIGQKEYRTTVVQSPLILEGSSTVVYE